MSKKLFNKKSFKQQHQEAINRLPMNDNQAIQDAITIYSAMSDDELNNLPSFCDDGSVKFYPVGSSLLGKLSLIQFVKSLKTK